MKYQAVFTRYELKYLLTIEQKKQITDAMAPYMALAAPPSATSILTQAVTGLSVTPLRGRLTKRNCGSAAMTGPLRTALCSGR